ncbi:MAG: DUF4260 domain-containing protein [Anaerolineales bacterium]
MDDGLHNPSSNRQRKVLTVRWLIRLEELALFGLSIWAFSTTGFAWYWYPLLLLTPDLSMLGYLAGPGTGAIFYNIVHHRALALAIFLAGVVLSSPALQLTGTILFGHSSLDRVFGYGLKHPDSFQHTHLGWIGQQQTQSPAPNQEPGG